MCWRSGAKIVRLDAFGYVTKEPGTRCFFQEPEVWKLLDMVEKIVHEKDTGCAHAPLCMSCFQPGSRGEIGPVKLIRWSCYSTPGLSSVHQTVRTLIHAVLSWLKVFGRVLLRWITGRH